MNQAQVASKICPSCGARYPTDALFCPNDGTPLTSAQGTSEAGADAPDPYLGREISGHIDVRQLAGIGAMGRVYRAFQRGIERDVAVKILHRELSANQQLVARFHREAKVASRLSHPNVVQVHLAGQLPDGAMYIVMEYLDGLSLQSALAAAGGAMPLPRALHIALQICDAAGEAHAQGIVHRDLKPENVMLVRRGEDSDYVKVLDFGIARLNWGEQSMATAAGLIFGTARYISPEGAQGEGVGPSGDVYAVATLLYQMLAGRTPFEGDQAVALLVQQIHDAPPPLRSVPRAAYVPDPIAAVVMKNLAKEPSGRALDGRSLGRMLLDAAKASGLSPEDLVPRSILLGSKAAAMQLAPMQRTKQLALGQNEPGVREPSGPTGEARERAEAAGAPAFPAPRRSGPTPAAATVAEAPPGGPARPEPSAAKGAAGAATTKWVPPAEFHAPLGPPGDPPPRARASSSSVDPTLDDEPPPPPPRPAMASEPRVRTELSEPAPIVEPYVMKPTLESPVHVPAAPSKPPSTVETTLNDEEAEVLLRRRRSRLVAVWLLCFLFGVIIGAAVLYNRGVIGPNAGRGSLDETISRADAAMRLKHWDEPSGDCVRDITDDGLRRWPGDPRLLDIRERSADELVKEAVGQRFAGDLPGALHLAHLANELDPTDTTAQHLVDEYEQETAKPIPSDTTALVTPDAGASTRPPKPAPPGATPHAAVDVSVPRPRVGQSVTFLGKVSAGGGVPRAIDDPHFRLSGPGLSPDTRLAALGDAPGVFRTAFAFLEPGRYEVTFDARVEGILLKATRTVIVDDTGAPPPTNTPLPPPSGKWL